MLGNDAHVKYLGFGSPLMDLIFDVDNDFLEKYISLKTDTYLT